MHDLVHMFTWCFMEHNKCDTPNFYMFPKPSYILKTCNSIIVKVPMEKGTSIVYLEVKKWIK